MPTAPERRRTRNLASNDVLKSLPQAPDGNVREPPTSAAWERFHEATEVRAYELYLARGGEHGHDLDDWLRAESELRQRGRSES